MESDPWFGLDVRQLSALRAVAEKGSFGRAAASLGYTQSAISQQIASLERLVGVTLIERPGGSKPVSLTEAGRVLLRHATSITDRVQVARADLEALVEGTTGRLRIGTYQSVGARLLPTALRRFVAEWPRVEISLHELSYDVDLLALLERGELDLTFATLPLVPGPFASAELMADPYVLVVAKGSPVADRADPPSPREVGDLPLIGHRHCRNLEAGLELMREAGGRPRVVFRSDDNGTLQGLAAAGMGVACMPLLTVDTDDDRIEVIPLDGRFRSRTIVIAWHRDRYQKRTSQAFVDEARYVCAEYAATVAA